MRARELIDHAAFGPDALKVIGQAFDEAWQEIAGNFGDRQDIEAGRFRLANAVLSIAQEESRNAESLKHAALARMLTMTFATQLPGAHTDRYRERTCSSSLRKRCGSAE
jgi:hypothetical protein